MIAWQLSFQKGKHYIYIYMITSHRFIFNLYCIYLDTNRFWSIHRFSHFVRLFDTCGQQLLDSVLGMAFMLYVIESSCADTIATSVMYWADVSVQLLWLIWVYSFYTNFHAVEDWNSWGNWTTTPLLRPLSLTCFHALYILYNN